MRTVPRVSTAAALRNQLAEAHQILIKVRELQQTGVELPASVLARAQERVDELTQALEEARKEKP